MKAFFSFIPLIELKSISKDDSLIRILKDWCVQRSFEGAALKLTFQGEQKSNVSASHSHEWGSSPTTLQCKHLKPSCVNNTQNNGNNSNINNGWQKGVVFCQKILLFYLKINN